MATLVRSNEPRQGKPGCLFYGCLLAIAGAVFISAAVGLAGYFGLKKLNQTIEVYTSTTPESLPPVLIQDDDYAALEKRLNSFNTALQENRADKLALTADELNALLEKSPSMDQWKGRIRVMMEGNQLRGQVSLPLDPVSHVPFLSRLRGRYLNGAARLDVGMEHDRLTVRLLGMAVNGKQLPAEVLRGLREVNFADAAYNNPKTAATLSKLARVQVRDGELLIESSGSPP